MSNNPEVLKQIEKHVSIMNKIDANIEKVNNNIKQHQQ